MKRRDFIVGVAIGISSGAVGAQSSARVYRVALMIRGKPAPVCGKLLAETLRGHGFEVGRNLEIRCVFLDDREHDVAWLRSKAKELVALKPDAIVVTVNEQARAVNDATASIPVVFLAAMVGNELVPHGMGRPLVKALANPGGNLTGLVNQYSDLALKRLELTRELLPKARRVALLANYPQMRTRIPGFPGEMEAGARGVGLELVHADASKDDGDIAATFARIMPSRPEAFMAFGEVNYRSDRFEVIESMQFKHRIPRVADMPGYGTVALGIDWPAQITRAYHIVARILKGAKPSDIPVEMERRFYMTVNLGAAKAIGLEVPRSLVVRADRVIE